MKKVTSYKLKVSRKSKSHSLATWHLPLATRSGFTLVEMMVSIAIFMVVAVVAVTALLKIVDANRKSETLQDAVNNINYAMDAITREIRVGSNYYFTNGYYQENGLETNPESKKDSEDTCSDGACTLTGGLDDSDCITFLSSNTDPADNTKYLTYSYCFAKNQDNKTWTIYKAQQVYYNDCILYTGSSCNHTVNYAPIIDPDIVITAYTIKVHEGDSNTQPSVFIYVRGYTGTDANTQTYFDIQTTISKRNQE